MSQDAAAVARDEQLKAVATQLFACKCSIYVRLSRICFGCPSDVRMWFAFDDALAECPPPFFAALDLSGNGWITRDDLASALPSIGMTLEPTQLDQVMLLLDPDRDGRIK